MSFDFESYQQKLRDLRDRLEKDDQALKIAVTDTVDEYYDRIFIEGKRTDGGKATYKSKREVYINPANSPKKFKPEGKPELTTKKVNSFTNLVVRKKRGNRLRSVSGPGFTRRIVEHKTKFFDSYKDFKSFIGKPILELYGELQSSVASGTKKLEDGSYILGVGEKEGKKMEGLQFGNGEWTGFGTIFKLSTEEKKLFFDTYKLEMRKDLTQ